MNSNLLVSCTVISYNSSSTIVETLESIKAQTYKNIELIVSDDASVDNTADICKEWIENNKKRFVRAELITVDHNTGVCANCSRCLNACEGSWMKLIAADDKLLPNCVEDFMSFVLMNHDAMWVSSKMRIYYDTFVESNYLVGDSLDDPSFFQLTSREQFKRIVTWNRIKAPSLFYKTDMLREVGGFDSPYSFEDYPLFVKIIEKGYKCYLLNKETVCYRVHTSSSHSSNELFNYGFLQESQRFHRQVLYKYLTKKQVRGQNAIWKLQDLIVKCNLNRNTPIISFFYKKAFGIINRIYGL